MDTPLLCTSNLLVILYTPLLKRKQMASRSWGGGGGGGIKISSTAVYKLLAGHTTYINFFLKWIEVKKLEAHSHR